MLRAYSDVEVVGVFTTLDEATDRVPIHAVPRAFMEEQARSAALPLHRVPIPSPCPNPVYEERVGGFLKSMDISHVAFGDLFLEDIRAYRERQFAASGLELLFPLWGRPTAALAREMTAEGLRAWITSVDLKQAPREWAGRLFDSSFVAGVPNGIDPCGENGEFHTFVFEGPMLRAPVRARPGAVTEARGFAYSELLAA